MNNKIGTWIWDVCSLELPSHSLHWSKPKLNEYQLWLAHGHHYCNLFDFLKLFITENFKYN